MTILIDKEIRALAKKGAIEPFFDDPHHLQPASYDLHIWKLTWPPDKPGGKIRTVILGKEPAIIRPGEFVSAISLETIRMPRDHVGRFGLKSVLIRRGVFGLWGTQIDPGYEGKIFFSLLNAGPRDVELKPHQTYLTIEIQRLLAPPATELQSYYQNKFDITEREEIFLKDANPWFPRQASDKLVALRSVVISTAFILGVTLLPYGALVLGSPFISYIGGALIMLSMVSAIHVSRQERKVTEIVEEEHPYHEIPT